jgi:hypothetical protein
MLISFIKTIEEELLRNRCAIVAATSDVGALVAQREAEARAPPREACGSSSHSLPSHAC